MGPRVPASGRHTSGLDVSFDLFQKQNVLSWYVWELTAGRGDEGLVRRVAVCSPSKAQNVNA